MEEIQEIIKNLPSVSNVSSLRGGSRNVTNQFIIYGNGFTLFQSYESPIAMKKAGKVYLFENWDYSVTTGKYRNDFLGETKKETYKKLKSGEYIAVGFEV